MHASPFFQAGGTVSSTSVCYITRVCDKSALETIFSRRYLTILGPRQVGKTSLLFKLQAILKRRSIPCAVVDLSTLQDGEKSEIASRWYNLLAAQLHHQFRESEAEIYQENMVYDLPSFVSFLNSFEVVSGPKKRAVIMFDEAAAVPVALKSQFFSRLRALFNNRPNPKAEAATRFDFVFAGAFYPSALVTETTVSPFNISNEVRVPDFQRHEVDILFQGLAPLGLEQEAADEIWKAAGGHPFLTQKMCQNLAHNCQGIITLGDVQDQKNDILQHDAHLQNVVRRLDESPAEVELIRRVIVKREKVRVNPNVNAVAAQLEMIGALTVGPDGFARVRNGIYGSLLRSYLSDRARA